MINANELRIGNWVYDFSQQPVQVIRLAQGIPLEQPIPLTSEILEKCGFKETVYQSHLKLSTIGLDIDGVHVTLGENLYVRNGPIFLHYINDDWIFIYGRDSLCTGRKIKYVHQLQNLYFSLTGEELDINLSGYTFEDGIITFEKPFN